jgi:hypothetical protein
VISPESTIRMAASRSSGDWATDAPRLTNNTAGEATSWVSVRILT